MQSSFAQFQLPSRTIPEWSDYLDWQVRPETCLALRAILVLPNQDARSVHSSYRSFGLGGPREHPAADKSIEERVEISKRHAEMSTQLGVTRGWFSRNKASRYLSQRAQPEPLLKSRLLDISSREGMLATSTANREFPVSMRYGSEFIRKFHRVPTPSGGF
jgi:hypothetical protein